MKEISIIVTSYNCEDTIESALMSIIDLQFKEKIQIIVVDDCSSDNTYQIVKGLKEKYEFIDVFCMDKNSGTPSIPRNIGIQKAVGEYITFLDSDDRIDLKALIEIVNYAKKNSLDFIKGYINIVRESEIVQANRLEEGFNSSNIISGIIRNQSTTIDIIVKRKYLIENKITFNEKLKVGEDTLFYSEIFKRNPHIEYIDKSYYYYTKKSKIVNKPSTQIYGDKELLNHLFVWNNVEKNLKEIGVSYYNLRLHVAIKNTLKNIVYFCKDGISENVFNKLHMFTNENKKHLKNNLILSKRYTELYNSILYGDYEDFKKQSKKRLLIAGYDLKFIIPIIKYIEHDYNIQIDEWGGHNIHDEKKSRKLLKWTDIIWCEWLLGNAVWYSKNKMSEQSLIIRAHRFEITREFGYKVNYNNVDSIVTVAYYYHEQFLKKFNIPRNKMNIISNYVEKSIYCGNKSKSYKKNIAIVGILPKRKGYLKALSLIKNLISIDKDFKLYVIGKTADETPWILNDKSEKGYYDRCKEYIKQNNLTENIVVKGWIDRSRLFEDVGYVLSLSDNEIPESFHLTPAEAFCDNSLGLYLNWSGVEYIYPKDIIFESIEDIEQFILKTYKDKKKYDEVLQAIKKFVLDNYEVCKFTTNFNNLIDKIVLCK